jgi:hypothetical protein
LEQAVTTIADRLDAPQLSKLLELATGAELPYQVPTPDPASLIDAACNDCGTELRVAPPVGDLVVCKDCAKKRVLGKAGRRFVKKPHPARVQAEPQELARAGGLDLSKMTPAEIGEAVCKGVLGMTVTRMADARRAPQFTPQQERQIVSLGEGLGLSRSQAIKVVLRKTS